MLIVMQTALIRIPETGPKIPVICPTNGGIIRSGCDGVYRYYQAYRAPNPQAFLSVTHNNAGFLIVTPPSYKTPAIGLKTAAF